MYFSWVPDFCPNFLLTPVSSFSFPLYYFFIYFTTFLAVKCWKLLQKAEEKMYIHSLKPFMKIHLSCFSDSRIYFVYCLECAARYELHIVKILNTMLPPMRFVEQFKQCRQTDRQTDLTLLVCQSTPPADCK